jgi:hypothetical protein
MPYPRQKVQMIEVGTGKAQRAFHPIKSDPGFPAEDFTTLTTLRLPFSRNENSDFFVGGHR